MTDTPATDALPAPSVILVKPQLGENIGTTARAMLNFGLTELRLVNPRDGWPNPAAEAPAAGATSVIEGASVHDSVDEAIADCHYVVATTARQRGLFLPVMTPREVGGELAKRAAAGERVAILFGGEKAGLATEDAARANALVTIPVNPNFSSLNLAQAVLVMGYEWAEACQTAPLFGSAYKDERASHQEMAGLYGHLFEVLDRTGYFYPLHKRPTLEHNLRTFFSNAAPSPAEVRLFRGVLRQIDFALAKKSENTAD